MSSGGSTVGVVHVELGFDVGPERTEQDVDAG
jgi:hypothetical protein